MEEPINISGDVFSAMDGGDCVLLVSNDETVNPSLIGCCACMYACMYAYSV